MKIKDKTDKTFDKKLSIENPYDFPKVLSKQSDASPDDKFWFVKVPTKQ